MTKLFGTDGIRGRANVYPITPDNMMKVAMALGYKLRTLSEDGECRIIIGKDTRKSSYMIENALCAGFIAAGANVFTTGPLPTPAISFLTRQMRCDAGVMISASHNPYYDNGIKLFDKKGFKLSPLVENDIEELVLNSSFDDLCCHNDKLGQEIKIEDAYGRYIEYLKTIFPKEEDLHGMKIVVDSANGAAHRIAGEVFWELGAEVIKIGNSPNGFNINENCGSMHPEILSKTVIENAADFGIALDGDADRIVIVDEKGEVASGDQLLALIAVYFKKRNLLSKSAIVATIMSNGNLDRHLDKIGISVIRSSVGDKYVFEEMIKNGINFGGENSGHIILGDFGSTGDGLAVGLLVATILRQSKQKASEILKVFDEMPQIKDEVWYEDKITDAQWDQIQIEVGQFQQQIKSQGGSVIVRKSGTEKKVRIMIECNDIKLAKEIVGKIADVIKINIK